MDILRAHRMSCDCVFRYRTLDPNPARLCEFLTVIQIAYMRISPDNEVCVEYYVGVCMSRAHTNGKRVKSERRAPHAYLLFQPRVPKHSSLCKLACNKFALFRNHTTGANISIVHCTCARVGISISHDVIAPKWFSHTRHRHRIECESVGNSVRR